MREDLTTFHCLEPLTEAWNSDGQGSSRRLPIPEIGFLPRSGLTHQPLLLLSHGMSSLLPLLLTVKDSVPSVSARS